MKTSATLTKEIARLLEDLWEAGRVNDQNRVELIREKISKKRNELQYAKGREGHPVL